MAKRPDAIGKGNLEIVEYLINHGAGLNSFNENKRTPIMLACEKKFIMVVKLLVSAGAEVDLPTKSGNTCLHYVCSFNFPSFEIAQYLIENCIDINATNARGRSSLMIACKKGNDDIVRLLLSFGADISLIDKNGQNALDFVKTLEVRRMLVDYTTSQFDYVVK